MSKSLNYLKWTKWVSGSVFKEPIWLESPTAFLTALLMLDTVSVFSLLLWHLKIFIWNLECLVQGSRRCLYGCDRRGRCKHRGGDRQDTASPWPHRVFITILKVSGSVGPRLLVGSPSGLLDFVLYALRALRPCDPRNAALDSRKFNKKSPRNKKLSQFFFEKSKHTVWVSRNQKKNWNLVS